MITSLRDIDINRHVRAIARQLKCQERPTSINASAPTSCNPSSSSTSAVAPQREEENYSEKSWAKPMKLHSDLSADGEPWERATGP